MPINGFQRVWWQQAKSDHDVLKLFRRQGVASCHQLHYLQMTTEKLAKAYFWQTGTPPARNYSGFVQYLRFLGGTSQARRPFVLKALGFKTFGELQNWTQAILPLAYDLERLAPALASNGPNPEYPWPHEAPTHVPATTTFWVWEQLTRTARGRQFVQVIERAVDRFPTYG
jgi:hypothetical protein